MSEQSTQLFSRCHPIRCPYAYLWPLPHSPHVPLYPSDWCAVPETIDGEFHGGAIPDEKDERDYPYEEVAGAFEVDWEKGYDIRDELGADFIPKQQYKSMSCVGQSASQLLWVHQVLEVMRNTGVDLAQLRKDYPNLVDEISAKAIYSQISLGYGMGASVRDGAMIGIRWGAVTEHDVPSYRPDGKTDEDFMYDKSWKNQAIDELARVMRGKEARVISASTNMDLFAQAIQQNHGVLGGVTGSNGRGWGYAERPDPPAYTDNKWGHGLYFGAFGQDQYGKYVAFPNSWGKIVKEEWTPGSKPGTGWQKIYHSYFATGYVFNPWTYVDKPNEVALDDTVFKYKFTKPIIYGQKGFEVKMLQKALSIDFGVDISTFTDGVYDDKTMAKVMEFQYKYQVADPMELRQVSGMNVGPKTRNQLNKLFNK